MKRIFLITAILALAITGLAAEELSLKGKITVTNRRFPELSSGNTVYYLMIPRAIVGELKEGEEVSITGEMSAFTPGKGYFTEDAGKYVKVKTMSARGKTVNVEEEFQRMRTSGKRQCDMGNRPEHGRGMRSESAGRKDFNKSGNRVNKNK